MTQLHPENCRDDSVQASQSAHVNINRFAVPRDPYALITAVLLALSILGNIAMYLSYRDLKQTVDLDTYDDLSFISGRFAEVAAQVKADHDLIQTYGLDKKLKEK